MPFGSFDRRYLHRMYGVKNVEELRTNIVQLLSSKGPRMAFCLPSCVFVKSPKEGFEQTASHRFEEKVEAGGIRDCKARRYFYCTSFGHGE